MSMFACTWFSFQVLTQRMICWTIKAWIELGMRVSPWRGTFLSARFPVASLFRCHPGIIKYFSCWRPDSSEKSNMLLRRKCVYVVTSSSLRIMQSELELWHTQICAEVMCSSVRYCLVSIAEVFDSAGIGRDGTWREKRQGKLQRRKSPPRANPRSQPLEVLEQPTIAHITTSIVLIFL